MRDGFVGVVHELADWVVRLVTANVLWFFVNIPVVFIFVNMLFVPIEIGIFYYVAPLAILMPTLFFPSTVTLFALSRDWVLKRPQEGIMKNFFYHFKANYKKSLQAGFLFTMLWAIWYGDYYYFQLIEQDFIAYLFVIIGIALFMYMVQFINLLVHFDMKLVALLKNAFYVTFGRPLSSILIFISFAVISYVSVVKLYFLLPFLTGAIIAFLSFFFFEKFSLSKGDRP